MPMALSNEWRDGAVYSQRLRISFYMLDCNGRIKPGELLRIFGALATDDFTDLGFDYRTLLDAGYFFIVVRASVAVLRQPRDAEEVIISTWPHRVRALQVARNFAMTTPAGEPLVEAQEIYMIISTDTDRVIRMDDFPYKDVIRFSSRHVSCPAPRRIKLADTAPQLACVQPTFDDIDVNQHVNNARYVGFVIDALPAGLQNRSIDYFLLAYDGQATQDELLKLYCPSASSQIGDLVLPATVDPDGLIDGNGLLTVVALKEDNSPCFGCSISFAKADANP